MGCACLSEIVSLLFTGVRILCMDDAQGRQLSLNALLLSLQACKLLGTRIRAPAGAFEPQQQTASAELLAIADPLQSISAAAGHRPPQHLQHTQPTQQ